MDATKKAAREAARLLAGLGDTPEEIYEMLLGSGYTGVRYNAEECPCGSCLRDHFGTSVYVRQDRVDFGDRPSAAKLKPQVIQFIRNFDFSMYRRLVRK